MNDTHLRQDTQSKLAICFSALTPLIKVGGPNAIPLAEKAIDGLLEPVPDLHDRISALKEKLGNLRRVADDGGRDLVDLLLVYVEKRSRGLQPQE